MLRHLRTPEAVAERVTARREANSKNRHRAQEDGAAVLQLLDHGMKTRAFVRIYEQPPVMIAGHGCDEPCNCSDEWSCFQMKFLHSMIRVSDPQATVAFFQLLGLEERRRMENDA